MSVLREKWEVEEIRKVIENLDKKTGLEGAKIPIHLSKSLGDEGLTLGTYRSGFRCFAFSKKYFNDPSFRDSEAIDVIRHEYCHYVVDELGLKEVYEDDDGHGEAFRCACAFLKTSDERYHRSYRFPNISEERLQMLIAADDLKQVHILAELERWGVGFQSVKYEKYMRKQLEKKYGRARVFRVNDKLVHEKYGHGIVLDERVGDKKQMLYVEFENGEIRFVQNRHVYKIINGQIMKPKAG